MQSVGSAFPTTCRPAPLQLMSVYNYSMSAANGVCCVMFVLALLRCDRFYSKERDPRIEAAALLYWLLKVAELLDTVRQDIGLQTCILPRSASTDGEDVLSFSPGGAGCSLK